MLSYLGMKTSGVYALQDNGAWTLRCIVHQLFGNTGAVILADIFTLACLTTCVGLITSISQYFSTLTSKLSYRQWVFGITGFSFLVCNQGLNTILSISVPVLNAVYPVAIVLIVMGLCDKWLRNIPHLYPWTVGATGLISVIFAIENLNVPLGFLADLLRSLPFYSYGMGWVTVSIGTAVVVTLVSLLGKLFSAKASSAA